MDFKEFIKTNHPDPDSLQALKVGDAMDQLNTLAHDFKKAEAKNNDSGFIKVTREIVGDDGFKVNVQIHKLGEHEIFGLIEQVRIRVANKMLKRSQENE